MTTALELFSGIGAFGFAARRVGVEVLAAYDQSREANAVYAANLGLDPRPKTLASIAATELPAADLWWLSPPCSPFTSRGRQRDDADPRAEGLLHLIGLLSQIAPRHALLLENVAGFVGSRCHDRLIEALCARGFHVAEIDLCPTDFGVPMRRPRRFVVGCRQPITLPPPPRHPRLALASFLDPQHPSELALDPMLVSRYGAALDVVDRDAPEAVLSCITRGYADTLARGGSFVREGGAVRRLAPSELARLLGFPDQLRFPAIHNPRQRLRLLGNSVDLRAITWLLEAIVPSR